MNDTAPTAAHDTLPAAVASNSAAALANIRDTITSHLKNTQHNSRNSLDTFRRIGEELASAKEILGHGAFGAWCETEPGFNFTASWRARLMRLAKEWPDVSRAMQHAERSGRTLGTKELSVNGALALLAEHRRAEAAANNADETEPRFTSGTTEAPRKATLRSRLETAERERDEARHQLSEVLATVHRLEKLKAELAEAPRPGLADAAVSRPAPLATGFPSAEGRDLAGRAPRVDAAVKARAHKIAAILHLEGATEGERSSARDRLRESADKLKLPLADYLTACALEPALVP